MPSILDNYSKTELSISILALMYLCDGARNVQKTEEVLCATYPSAFCFQGDEHVLSLFFGNFANFKPVKMSKSNIVSFLIIQNSKLLSTYSYHKNMLVVNCVWVQCQSSDPCTDYDTRISSEQLKKDRITLRSRNWGCNLVLCYSLSSKTEVSTLCYYSQSNFPNPCTQYLVCIVCERY